MSRSQKSSSAASNHNEALGWALAGVLNKLLGLIVMVVLTRKWSNYLAQLHDNQYWFTNIKVENIEHFLYVGHDMAAFSLLHIDILYIKAGILECLFVYSTL